MPELFNPLTLRSVTLPNRIVLSPLCMYMAKDGFADDWHLSHLTGFARGGAGLVFTEATAVEPRGRITHGCCGLWTDGHAEAYRPTVELIEKMGAVPAIQIAHAGRKASAGPPFAGGKPLTPEDAGADAEAGSPPWATVAPSATPVAEGWPTPHALDADEIAEIVEAFAAAAGRAAAVGFRVLEIHGAHGYLIHSFLSPLANSRNDAYGGDLRGRMRFGLEVAQAVRAAWPDDLPLFMRISAVDGRPEGWSIEDSVVLARELAQRGVDVIDCSAGGIGGAPAFRADDEGRPFKPGGERPPGFQVPYAAQIRREAGVKTMAVGVIIDPHQAEEIIASGRADLAALGRELLYNPFWPLHAAEALDADPEFERWQPSYSWAVKRRADILKAAGMG